MSTPGFLHYQETRARLMMSPMWTKQLASCDPRDSSVQGPYLLSKISSSGLWEQRHQDKSISVILSAEKLGRIPAIRERPLLGVTHPCTPPGGSFHPAQYAASYLLPGRHLWQKVHESQHHMGKQTGLHSGTPKYDILMSSGGFNLRCQALSSSPLYSEIPALLQMLLCSYLRKGTQLVAPRPPHTPPHKNI